MNWRLKERKRKNGNLLNGRHEKRSCKTRPFKIKRAQERIRTFTPLRALRPEHSASTNFATWASRVRGCKYRTTIEFKNKKVTFFQRFFELDS